MWLKVTPKVKCYCLFCLLRCCYTDELCSDLLPFPFLGMRPVPPHLSFLSQTTCPWHMVASVMSFPTSTTRWLWGTGLVKTQRAYPLALNILPKTSFHQKLIFKNVKSILQFFLIISGLKKPSSSSSSSSNIHISWWLCVAIVYI